MSGTAREIREKLVAGDAEFRNLAEEHSRYEAQLEQLYKTPYVSAEDILLEANLKKMKLRVKDEMEKRIALVSKSVSAFPH
jgi:uncharacterized protein YdcH (DUF465 family)